MADAEEASGVWWVLERAAGSALVFVVLGALRACWNRMRSSQRLALVDALDSKRNPHLWLGTPTERRALLVAQQRGPQRV
jgi:hypothetical protein